MPIVEALGNKNLEKPHWEEIKQILNTDFAFENLDFNLGTLVQFNVSDKQEELVNVSISAS